MTTAGLCETSGDWRFDLGLPGKGGLGTFASPPDGAEHSVQGQFVARFPPRQLGMALFVSQPAGRGEAPGRLPVDPPRARSGGHPHER
jgi:glutaminase